MSRTKILILGEIEHAHKEWKALCEIADVIELTSKNREEFKQDCKTKYDGVLAMFRTFASFAVVGLIDEDLIASFPSTVKFLCHNGAGYDQIDTDACAKRGIQISNVPTAVDDSTADANMFLIIGALRNFNAGMAALRRNEWRGAARIGNDPQGKILGILGMGGIGRTLKRRCDVFDMKTIYHNRDKLPHELEAGAQYVSYDELLRTSDVISLNLPLNQHTRHIIGREAFNKMKDGVIIVNTARGAVIDEAALVEALDSNKVACAGLDVYEEEPKIHPGLVRNEKCVLLPHMGTWSYETQLKMELCTLDNIKSAILHGKLINIIPEHRNLKLKP